MLHDPSTASSRKSHQSSSRHRNFGRHVGDYTSATQMLSAYEVGVFYRLENAAWANGNGILLADDFKGLARIAGDAVNRVRKALDSILHWCTELCRLAGGKLIFERAQEELAYCEERAAKARASVSVRYDKNRKASFGFETSHCKSGDDSTGKKSNEINDTDATNVDRSHYSTSTSTIEEPKGSSEAPPPKEDSGKEGKPRRQRAKKAEASPPPPPPEDWVPTEKVIADMMAYRGISKKQIDLQVQAFVHRVRATNNKYGYTNFNSAFRNWITGEWYKPIPEPAPASSNRAAWAKAIYGDVESEVA